MNLQITSAHRGECFHRISGPLHFGLIIPGELAFLPTRGSNPKFLHLRIDPSQLSLSDLPLLGRQDEHERLIRLLARGRSVRLTGPAGSGRTSLLDIVAADCADLAPDGVVRLSGFRRTADDLLHDLFHAVHSAPLHRLDRAELLDAVREHGVREVDLQRPTLEHVFLHHTGHPFEAAP